LLLAAAHIKACCQLLPSRAVARIACRRSPKKICPVTIQHLEFNILTFHISHFNILFI